VYFFISLPAGCGASVSTIDIDPETPTTIYIGTSDDGLYKSADGGRTWLPVDLGVEPTRGSGIRPLSISGVAIDPRNPANIYVSARYTFAYIPEQAPRQQGIGVFKSTDGGAHWRRVGARTATSIGVGALIFDPADPTTLYAGTSDGVFKSTDEGETWEASSTGMTDRLVRKLIIDPRVPTTFYAATSSSIFKSTDRGATWRILTSFGPLALVLDPRSTGTIYAGGSGVIKSSDGGVSWNPINAGFAATMTWVGTIVNGSPVRTSPTVYTTAPMIWALAIDPTSPRIVYAVTAGGSVFVLRQ
jgi:photosystem II stability/assembly factor-like uncharacterized protein